MQFIKPGTSIDFIGRRKMAFAVSAVLILISIVSLIWHKGPRYGVDFAGGTQVLVEFSETVSIEGVKAGLQEMGLQDAMVQESRDDGTHLFQIRTIAPLDAESGLLQKMPEALKTATGVAATLLSVDMVGPQVSQDLRGQALFAMFYALLFITIYISGRFELKWMLSGVVAGMFMAIVYLLPQMVEKAFHVAVPVPYLILIALICSLVVFWKLGLRFAMGAIVALIHDVLITVGVFSLLDIEFNLPIIAALLTIIGYSLNDTIIVFDRVRENQHKEEKLGFAGMLNKSINETLSRTILTSMTTLLVLVALFFFGGGIIHDFSTALLIGVLIGTYSSIFVASPILLAWQEQMGDREPAKA